MRSLRLRLILPTAAATAAVLAVLAVSLYLSMRSALIGDFDDATRLKAASLVEMTEQHLQRFVFEGEFDEMPEFAKGRADPEYFQIVLANGDVLAASPSLAAAAALPLDPAAPACRPYTTPAGRPARLLTLTFTPRYEAVEADAEERVRRDKGEPMPTHAFVPGPVTLLVARPTAALDAILAALRLHLILLGSAAVVASSVLMALVIRVGLRPVATLAARISDVEPDDLSTQITLDHAPTELTPVVRRLNELLARVHAAIQREHAFSADVAHELRTPLAGLQTALEVSASKPRQPRDYRQTIAVCLAATRRMAAMVDNLLTLARAESDQSAARPRRVELGPLLTDAWLPFAARVAERRLSVEWNLADDLAVECDPDKLGLILRNLFDNAVSYADAGGTVSIGSRVVGSEPADSSAGLAARRVVIGVRNTGSPLTAADVPHLFERFWRHDQSRSADGHHGLGLPLCARIAAALGGTLSAAVLADRQFEISLVLPVAEDAGRVPQAEPLKEAVSRGDRVTSAS